MLSIAAALLSSALKSGSQVIPVREAVTVRAIEAPDRLVEHGAAELLAQPVEKRCAALIADDLVDGAMIPAEILEGIVGGLWYGSLVSEPIAP